MDTKPIPLLWLNTKKDRRDLSKSIIRRKEITAKTIYGNVVQLEKLIIHSIHGRCGVDMDGQLYFADDLELL